jgi:hypothetical protein
MFKGRKTSVPLLLIAAGGLVVGLAVPAAAHETSHLINGKSIAIQSIPGNRLKVNTLTGRQINESTLGAVPKAHGLSPRIWHPLTLQNGWVSYNSGTHGTPSYAMLAPGVILLHGAISGGTDDSVAFTLPAALHPTRVIDVADAQTAGDTGVLLIQSNGTVEVIADQDHATSVGFTSLDGVIFSVS